MKGLVGRLILLSILSFFLYKNRFKLINILVSIEGIRRLMGSFDMKLIMDGRELIKDQLEKYRESQEHG